MPEHSISRRILLILILNFVLLLFSCRSADDKTIVIRTGDFSYEISPGGKNISFIDRSTGIDYLKKDEDSWCAIIKHNGISMNVTKVTLMGKHLKMEFGTDEISADILIEKGKNLVRFTVNEVKGDPESLTFLNIPLNLEGMPYEPFSACALSMNLYTHVRQIPALQTHLWASCYKRFGFSDAAVSLIGLPTGKMLPTIREVISRAKDIPFSDKGGAWALMQQEGYGSYLMNFGTLTEESTEEWVRMCKNLGFNQIDSHGGGDFFRFGDFELNREKWPDGWENFKRINQKLHDAGISSIFHTYAFFIDKNSKYVTPIPREDLAFFGTFTLASPLSEGDTEIIVNEPTSNISTTTGFFVRNSLSLRIGSEIIEFKEVTKTPPYKFTGCRRGMCGTSKCTHQAGEKAYHLREMFGRFVPDPESDLFKEIAAHTAEIVNQCGFDGIYFDAIDGSDILGGEENFWYYGTSFIFEVAKRLERPVGMEMSSMSHHWWHYRSRWQAWDRPVRGYKRFIDIHSAAIKSTRLFLPSEIRSNENEHGLWRGHTPLIERYAPAENGGLMLPLHLGWWGNQTWNPPQVEPTFPDDIEYLCCKLIGNNAGFSMLGGADEKTLEENPLFGRIVPLIRQYEDLRHRNYFSDSARALLRQPGREFTLVRDDDDDWYLKPITYSKHKVEGLNHPSSKWTICNEYSDQPLKLRLEPLMSVMPYNDPSGIVIADFSHPELFIKEGNADGVNGSLVTATERQPFRGSSAVYSASVSGVPAREGLWLKMQKEFDPWLDLSGHQGIGVWVSGDGNGELLNIRLESPRHLSHGARGDHFIKINFTGWKYFELVEIESSEFSNYIWPDSGFYVYDSFRHTIQFNNVDKLQLWYNNLAADKETRCVLGTIKALPLVSVCTNNPEILVNGQKITFLTDMKPGMYLEFRGSDDCRLYGPKGELLRDVEIDGTIPVLKAGDNNIEFSCGVHSGINPRFQVTLITEGNRLLK